MTHSFVECALHIWLLGDLQIYLWKMSKKEPVVMLWDFRENFVLMRFGIDFGGVGIFSWEG